MNKNLPVLMIVMILFLLWGCGGKEGESSGKDDKPIRIGYMICNSLEETRDRFEPLTAYLSEKTGRKFESIYVNTFDFEDLVKDKKVDFTHTNSILPIIFQEGYGLELLAVEERGRHGHRETGTIISLKKSCIKTFDYMR